MTAFPARYPGPCAADCGTRIHEGDPIRMTDDGAVHDDCTAAEAREPDPLRAEHPVCSKCWLTHPEGACDR